jgi:type I restriction enzyme S subunit
MELKSGYKKSELGTIPKQWDVASFSELFDFRNGVNADKKAYGTGVPFINVLEVITNTHLFKADIPGRISLGKSQIEPYTVRHGDVVFNRTSETQEEVGLSAVYMDSATVVFGGFVIRGRPKNGALDPKYSGYAFRASGVRSQIIAKGQGAIRANVGQADLRQVLAPLPPLAEQRVIALALGETDKLIHGLDRLLEKKRNLRQAAIQHLLTGKIRLPGFNSEWKLKRLRDLGSFFKGRGITKAESLSGDLPCIRYGEIYTRHNDYIKTFYSRISRDVAASATRMQYGDILFAGSGETKDEIGKCVAFVGKVEAYAGGDIIILRPDDAEPLFLGYYLNTTPINRQKASRGQGDAVVHISGTALSDIQGKFPARPEQAAIAAVLYDMDAELTAIADRRHKLHAVQQGMMQELLTGRIRLV